MSKLSRLNKERDWAERKKPKKAYDLVNGDHVAELREFADRILRHSTDDEYIEKQIQAFNKAIHEFFLDVI